MPIFRKTSRIKPVNEVLEAGKVIRIKVTFPTNRQANAVH